MDLDVPHFHHEITFESVQIALENGNDTVINEILALLKHFSDCGMISVDQMTTVRMNFIKYLFWINTISKTQHFIYANIERIIFTILIIKI